MKSNQEILDEFGKIIVRQIVDRYYNLTKKNIFNGSVDPKKKKYNSVFEKLNNDDKVLLKSFIVKNYHSIIFDFLNIFEEHENFKLYFESDTQKVDLVKISEMLKAELIIENGWIKSFTDVVEDEDIF